MKALTLFLFATAMFGQTISPKTTPVITLKFDTIGCTTPVGSNTFNALSWSFGANQASSSAALGGAASSGRVNIQNLTIVRAFDECSPRLFAAVASGQKQPQLILTQTDAGGKTVLMTVKLQNVGVANYQIGGSPGSDQPSEQISFSFTKISITNNVNGATAGWDVSTNKPF